MVQAQFSRPLFCVASAFWVSQGSVSVEQRQCLTWHGHGLAWPGMAWHGMGMDLDLDLDLDLDISFV